MRSSLLIDRSLRWRCLRDAGGFFYDRPVFVPLSVEDRIKLALADDHVLVPSNARVGEHLVHIEQAASDSVDLIIRRSIAI